MSIELPKQPHDGRPRACYKCKVMFTPPPEHRNARQCQTCRSAPSTGRRRPAYPRHDGHSHAWADRSLGHVESDYLRYAWGVLNPPSVTRNRES